jgi:hypothetical protein
MPKKKRSPASAVPPSDCGPLFLDFSTFCDDWMDKNIRASIAMSEWTDKLNARRDQNKDRKKLNKNIIK